ncbi:lantibiotic dehydratase [Dactylosporangium roseum]|uniref:Lantibiotic dehydratase n=1 Tax=Dactylosporangium roseum TaxID=47989 RepID=A0ABY5ZBE4_9ACTN|nr:lantibiotic dehydratase family protein [Dactylosporangium roseum]UWZ39430.1 lantibiotic dehydratase [Dactylosporangium roseum]
MTAIVDGPAGVPLTGPAHLLVLADGWSVWRTAAVRGAGLPFDLVDTLALRHLGGGPAGTAQDRAVRDASIAAVDDALRRDDFLTALTWQNPQLVQNWVAPYRRELDAGRRPALRRRHRRDVLIARYLQRYCAKNETVGFFGGVGWAALTDRSSARWWRGTGTIRRSSVHFEVWAIDAVAEAWRQDPLLLPHLPVRLDPASSLDGGVLRRPRRRPWRLDETTAAILAAVDGHRRVGEIAAVLDRHGAPETVVATLVELHDRAVVRIGFPVPCDERPEAGLCRRIEALPPAAPSARPRADLGALGLARDEARAAATPTELLFALDRVANVLARVTGGRATAPVAAAGGLPTGRTPLYLDCRRDLDVELGPDKLDRLRLPFALLLRSARWLVAEVADQVEQRLRACHAQLRTGRDDVRLSDLQFLAADVLTGSTGRLDDVQADFQARWAAALPPDAAGPVCLSAGRLEPVLRALFPARPLRWAAARHHTADLLLARTRDGAAQWVLGELHLALNTLESRVFLTQADDPDALRRATASDMRRGRVVPVYPNDAREVSPRTYPPLALDPPGLYRYWSYGADAGHASGAHSTPATAVRVVERGGELVGTAPAGWEAPVLEFFGEFLSALAVNLFRLRGPRPHAPRVAIDDLVVCRETWRFDTRELPAPVPGRPGHSAAWRAMRGWAERCGLPRRVFVRTAGEPKPFYVDFDAPLLVDNLARAVRRGSGGPADVEVTEMLPAPEDFWLVDPAGQRYSTELRVVAVDAQEVPVVVRPARPHELPEDDR